MIVDTGASTIVLPSSLIARLGFDPDALASGIMETANRRVPGKKAVLASAEIGEAVERDVAVTFIDDSRLGGTMLLGMSFLGRFRMTIDDADNRITLSRSRLFCAEGAYLNSYYYDRLPTSFVRGRR